MVSTSLSRVILTDPHHARKALPILRSLGRRGICVTCLYNKDDFLKSGRVGGAVSKYCKKLIISEDLISDIIELSKHHSVLIPLSTSTVDLVSRNLSIINEHINVPIPDFQTIYKARNKEYLLKHCLENGIPIPTTYFIDDFVDLERVTQNVGFPAVIKFRDEMFTPYPRYVIVNCREELIREYKRMHEIQKYPMIQEYIEGKGVGFFALYNQYHQPKAIFCHERLREYPPDGGQSALCRSIYDEELVSYGSKVLSTLNWYGVAMVEFKLDQENKLRIMEVNPRFWGSLQLAILSGVDFPFLLYRMAIDGDIKPTVGYKTNVKMRHLALDLRALIEYVRLKRQDKTEYVMGLMKGILDKNIHESLIARDDLKPFLIHCLELPKKLIAFTVKNKRRILARIVLPIQEMRVRKMLKRIKDAHRDRLTRPHYFDPLPRRILFVCYGNICRSPFAEHYWNHVIRKKWSDLPEADSAGFIPKVGRHTPARIEQLAGEFGVDLGGHRSDLMIRSHADAADAIFIMDRHNHRNMLSLFSDSLAKIHYLGMFDDEANPEIPDPYLMDTADARICLKQIIHALNRLGAKMQQ
jgi:predicted ATP-grasp superfamily ATP-dependent carboligase